MTDLVALTHVVSNASHIQIDAVMRVQEHDNMFSVDGQTIHGMVLSALPDSALEVNRVHQCCTHHAEQSGFAPGTTMVSSDWT